ncbi:MAG: hypothetical protein VKJ86_01830, partial [Synechococcus sp.]|nr:hypothetical protein [Synechococcus sp.]
MKIKSYSGIVTGAVAATTFLVAPARAANVEVRNLEVRSGEGKVELALNLAPGDSLGDGTPQVSTTQKDRAMITEIANAQLNLGNGQEIFSQENPLPGIERIEVMEAAPGKVHIVALGEVAAPTGEILSQDSNEILLNVVSGAPTATAQAAEASTVIEPTLLAQSGPNISNPNDFLQPAAPVPPFLPRASAPPVGDISISTIDTRIPSYVNLGTNAVIPRLVLKDAPVEDVLGLLARSANLNVVLQEDVGDVTIRSLDLENEPVQDAFSYVLMLSDLKAVMKGR